MDDRKQTDDLLARVAAVLRNLDKDYPEWGLRTLAEECEQAAAVRKRLR